jgi:transposase
LTSKIHAVVDANGLPVRLALTAGQAHDNRLADNFYPACMFSTTVGWTPFNTANWRAT